MNGNTYTWKYSLTNISSDNGLSPGRRQAIIWTSVYWTGPWVLFTLSTTIQVWQQPHEKHMQQIVKLHVFLSKTAVLFIATDTSKP